ncbi:3-carboxyethylcatechol 2,3-dioxygenase [Nocardia sp. NPDC052278]|uniref:3-carboxyethylcatechol 2,3-dioxygenase n=1 Tax=unclassified Nocardia TaxID=2637762 RepID=UPI0036901876
MSVALVCMSHSPLLEYADPPAEVREEVDGAFARARAFVGDYDPQLIISFAPDHYNGFFYELMPPFCVGYAAEAVGDYGSQAGPLQVPGDLAAELAQHVLNSDIDMAISRRMEIDHGAVQPLEVLLGGIDTHPVIPIFVNGVAQPFTSMRRIRLMGAAIGEWVAGRSERVLLVGSGGLSHDPPVPQWATATPQQRDMLLAGRNPTAAARDARQRRVIEAARLFARGEADIRDLNPEWDNRFLDLCASGELSAWDAMEPDRMADDAGNSAHEVRTWLAAFAALAAAGRYEMSFRYYRPIPEFIAGFGVVTAQPQ